MHLPERLPLAELCAGRVRLQPEHVSAIVRRACLSTAALTVTPLDGSVTPFGPAHVWLDRTGHVHLAPGVWPTVRDLGALLEHLLGEVRRQGTARMPPGLLIAAARATGKIDAAPLPSADALARALARFDPPDPDTALRELFESASVPSPAVVAAPAPLAMPPRTSVNSRPRRFAAALLGSAAFAGGIAAALVLQPAPGPQPTDETEVTVTRSSDREPRRTASTRRSTAPASSRVPTRAPSSGSAAGPQADRHAAPRAPAAPARIAPPVDRAITSAAARPLIEPASIDADAAFSPSFDSRGTAVFFHAQSGSTSALKRAERDESGVLHVVTVVDDAAKNYHVQVSPDGRSVAFDSDRDGVRGVYVANVDGSNVRRVSGPGYAAVPTWSGDGERLAFLRAETNKPRVWNLWVKDLRGGEMRRLTSHAYGQVWGGSWFPDGRRLAYSHEDRLVLIDLETGRAVSYASPRKGHLVRTPAVSPDGRWIIFQVFRDGAWLLDLDTGVMTRALDDPSAEEFTWTPDGRRVAFHSRRSGEWGLWVMAAR